MSWEKLNDRQKIKTIETNNGQEILVIVPNNFEDRVVPLYCETCQMPMLSKEDIISYQRHQACEECHYHSDRLNFNDPNDPKVKSYLAKRLESFKRKMKIKIK